MSLEDLIMDSLLQLVVGYLFITVFNFVSLKRNTKDIEHLFLSSIAVGFIIVNLMKLIPYTKGYYWDCTGICVTSVITAYILGMILTSGILEKLLDIFHIRQSVQSNTWAEIMDVNKSMKVKIVLEDNTTYYGYVSHIGEEEKPFIALAAYKIDDGVQVLDNNKMILVNTENIKYSEIIYNPHSEKCIRIKSFNDVVRKSRSNSQP